MSDLAVVIPTYNEGSSIIALLERIENTLGGNGLDYSVYIIDDHSVDNTRATVENYIKNKANNGVIYDSSGVSCQSNGKTKIKLILKKGKKGKAFSILEGASVNNANYIAMIDADLQYPPEAILPMYERAKKHGVCVANRKVNNTSFLRKWGSRMNVLVFEKMLLGLDCDTQSGLKVFKRDIVDHLEKDEVTPWTLDMPLLIKAQELGYKVSEYDIEFSERKNGESKVNFVKTSIEIASSAVKLRFRNGKIYNVFGESDLIGSGVVYKGKKFITHTNLVNEKSAIKTFYKWQKITLAILVGVGLMSVVFFPLQTAKFLLSILTLIYFADLIFSTYLLIKSLHFPPEIDISEEEIDKINDDKLPVYSILCPLYKEANVLPEFVEAINKIDWPKDKLDVLLLLEQDDEETITVANSLGLSDSFKILVVPHSFPKTKPKACNFGFAHAKGEYVVIYDAEDKPDPLQLKKAYLAFNRLDPKVVCLQSKLNYYNKNQNLLTRMFTAEYSLWFDLVLPGLQIINTTIPLGGTSNHFRRTALKYLSAWDPFNVTEDCDLGARLFKEGFKTAIINSTTYEEANSQVKSWIKQRSRWIKGYLQTYLVHMRDPVDFYKKHGLHSIIFQLVIGMRMTFILINPILWAVTITYFAFRETAGPVIESLYPPTIFYIGVVCLVFGNFIYFYNYMIGLAKRREWYLIKYVFFVPFYWVLSAFAAVKAFYQLFIKPYHWEKTQHGLHLPQIKKKTEERAGVNIRVTIDTSLPSKVFGIPQEVFNYIRRYLLEIIDIFMPLPQLSNSQDGLNILLFNWRDVRHEWAGGAERYIQEISKNWVREGHSVTLFASWDGKTKRYEEIDGVKTIRRGGFFSVYVLAFLYYALKLGGKYDIVVDCENGIPFFTPLYSTKPKVLLIHHIHREVHQKYLTFPLSFIAIFLESVLMPAMYKKLPIVTVSKSSKEDIIASGLAGEGRISVINPGVEMDKFTTGEKTNNPSFVYFGRVQKYKNIGLALFAFAEVLKKHSSATFTIAGEGDDRVSLEKLSKKLGIHASVNFLGRVDNSARTKLLAESWVALQPSIYEGWGITVIEANASATPVIASNVKGLKDSVKDGVTGMLFKSGDYQDLALKMEEMIVNTKLRDELSSNALEWSASFNWNDAAGEFQEIVYSAVGGRKGLQKAYQLVKK